MKLFALIFCIALLIGTAYAVCPLKSDETKEDCPWAEIGRAQPQQFEILLDQELKNFKHQLKQDRATPKLLSLWGLSQNADVTPDRVIVPSHIMNFLHDQLGVKKSKDFKINHAGLTHTYGYLFSNLQTPYGYKRARYVKGETEDGFGLPQGVFNGTPTQGTLLSNLTYFISKIAFEGEPLLDHIPYALWKIHPALLNFNFKNLKKMRLIEKSQDGKLELRTDFVLFDHPNTRGKNEGIYIYSIREHQGEPRLITAFPVLKSAAQKLFEVNQLGATKSMKPVFNAVLTDPELRKQTLWTGERKSMGHLSL